MSVDKDEPVDEAEWRMKLRRSGSSTVVTLPTTLLKLADMEAGDEVDLVKRLGADEIRLQPDRNRDSSESSGE